MMAAFKKRTSSFEEGLKTFSDVSRLNVGSAIMVRGIMKATPTARQPFEILASSVI